MEETPLSATQVFVITNIEVLISGFNDNPEVYFQSITGLIDANRLFEYRDIMQYLYELLERKGLPEFTEEFARKYDIKPGNP